MTLRIVSFFSGIGGFDAAFLAAGHQIVGACEIDEAARAVYTARFGEPAWFPRDVADVRAQEVPEADVWCGGWPCTDNSVAGLRAGMADETTRSGLWWTWQRLMAARRPLRIVAENVPGMLSVNGGRDFGAVVASLLDVGYAVAWATIDARWFGVAQRRRRIFIAASLRGDPRAILFDATARPRSGGPPDAVLHDGTWASPQAGLFGGGEVPFDGASWPSSGYAEGDRCYARADDEERDGASHASLADTLERGPIHPRFYLSARACAGILRRAERRGRDLPVQLESALRAVADGVGADAQSEPLAFESRFARNGRGAPDGVVPALKATVGVDGRGDGAPLAFYPTAGTRSVEARVDESPAIKCGSGVGIPSAPAVLVAPPSDEQEVAFWRSNRTGDLYENDVATQLRAAPSVGTDFVAFGGGKTSGAREDDTASALQGGGRRGHRIDAEGAVGGQLVVSALGAAQGGADDNDAQGGRLVVGDTSSCLRAADGHHGRSSPRGDGSDALVVVEGDSAASTPDLPRLRAGCGRGGETAVLVDEVVAGQCGGSNVGDVGALRTGDNVTSGVPFVVVGQQHGSDVGAMGALRAGHGDVQSGVPFVVHAAQSGAKERHAYESDHARCIDGTGAFASAQGGTVVLAVEAPGRKMSGGAKVGDGVRENEAYALDADPRVQAVCIGFNAKGESGNGGLGAEDDVAPPMRGTNPAAVAGFVPTASATAYGSGFSADLSPSIKVGSSRGIPSPPGVVAFGSKSYAQDAGDLAPTLRSVAETDGHENGGAPVAVAFDTLNQATSRDSPTLRDPNGTFGDGLPAAYVSGAVRRLTPSECEALQGGAHGWTCRCGVECKKPHDRRVPAWWPAGVTMGGCGHATCGCKCSDGARYKQLGNGVAVPCVAWIARRLA